MRTQVIDDAIAGFYALHQSVHTALTAAMRGSIAGVGSLAIPMFFAMALGALHALTPGHGKSVIVSYFLGRDARLAAGIGAGLKVAAGHVLLAALLVALFGMAVAMMGRPTGAAAALHVLAHVAIAVSGAWLLYNALRRPRGTAAVDRHQVIPALAGLIPCPLTMLLLIYALATTSFMVTVLLVMALGVGIAVTIGGIGLVAILARRFMVAPLDPNHGWYPRIARSLEIASAGVILLVGIVPLLPA
jgi:nickel/cobalt transporter (NicO) family protein